MATGDALLPGQLPPLQADDPRLRLRQILNEEGVADAQQVAALDLPAELHLRLYQGMLRVRMMDERFLAMQRQGRIGFYGEARGQEAAVIGTAAALGEQDYVVPALREAGAALYRGLPLSAYVAQLFGNGNDISKGRQMPCHPGSRAARYVTMSSCIATQLPHATGMAMAARLRGDDTVITGYLGDGATAEGDFHAALNFAGVFQAPVVFVCQNNQWAISTPVAVQTAAATIAQKAVAYGLPFLRCDGNDVLACYAVMREAVARARSGGGPTLIEALTYRVSAHSSSDDPSRYRDESITQRWLARDPIPRYRRFLTDAGLLRAERDEALRQALDAEIREVAAAEEAAAKPPLSTLIEDVFAAPTAALREQLDEILPFYQGAAAPRHRH